MLAIRPSRAVLVWVLFWLITPVTTYAQSLRETTSLRFVPATASMYSVSLRNRETFERFLNSRAFAKLKSLPLVQLGISQLREQLENNDSEVFGQSLDGLTDLLAEPENQQLIKVLLDGLSHEVFVYGDSHVGDWLATLPRLSQKLNMAQMQAAQRGVEPDKIIGEAIVDVVEKNPQLLRVPGSVIGLRLTDPQPATAQLNRLETMITEWIDAERPDWKDRVDRQQIGGSSFLTLKVDGTVVEWDRVLDDVDLDDGAKEKVKAQLEKIAVTVSLGIRDGYLLLSLGEDDSQLRALGEGSLLVDHPKIAPLAKYFDRKVNSIGYASAELMQQIISANQQMDQMVEMLRTALPSVPLADDVKEDLLQDVEQFADEAKSLQPRAGAISSVTFEVDGGYESVAYNWSEQRTLDGSQPLTVLDNVGGDPIAFYATRRKVDPASSEFMRRWGVKVGQYFDRVAVPYMQDEQKTLYEEVKKRMLPLLARVHAANQDKLGPALADGQSAIVLHASPAQPQWHAMMPPSNGPLPLPQLAWVIGVSDAGRLREGAAEYFAVLQASITAMSEIMPDKVPPIQLPGPQSTANDNGAIYAYNFASLIGLDAQIAPNAGLSDSRLVVSLFPSATQQLLETRSPELSGPLGEVHPRPLATAWQFHFHRFIQMLRPWANYSLQIAEQQNEVNPMIPEHVSVVLDVLECIRTHSGYSFFEDDALVSHSRVYYQDLAPNP